MVTPLSSELTPASDPRKGHNASQNGLSDMQNQSTSANKSHTGIALTATNGDQAHTTIPSSSSANTPNEVKLTPAEQKSRNKAEKAARRERQKAAKGAVGTGSDATQGAAGNTGRQAPGSAGKSASGKAEGHKHLRPGDQQRQKPQGDSKSTRQNSSQDVKAQFKASTDGATSMPIRRRGSQGGNVKEQKRSVNEVALFGHLYGQQRRQSIEGATKEVHPAVVALGLQMSSYVVCGSNARCVAMLLAFKSVIESYTTPPGTSLARHLTSHHLSPQIDYLRSCRPISIAMGNAIRWLKDLIIKIDPDVPETAAKAHLLNSIDTFIRERFTAADAVIADSASEKIVAGDVVLTYAHSSIVAATLLAARAKGTPFRVIIVDSKPLFEGKRLTHRLIAAGIDVSYTTISGAAYAVREATKVFLGAHAMLSNGRLYSRVGTAAVAMLAHERDVPVIVCCESVKFTDKVALDSIVGNELAPAEELLGDSKGGMGQSPSVAAEQRDGQTWGGSDSTTKAGLLQRWRETPNLQILNILYDVTPAEYIKMVVTEYGSLPPSSVPVVHRISTNG